MFMTLMSDNNRNKILSIEITAITIRKTMLIANTIIRKNNLI